MISEFVQSQTQMHVHFLSVIFILHHFSLFLVVFVRGFLLCGTSQLLQNTGSFRRILNRRELVALIRLFDDIFADEFVQLISRLELCKSRILHGVEWKEVVDPFGSDKRLTARRRDSGGSHWDGVL